MGSSKTLNRLIALLIGNPIRLRLPHPQKAQLGDRQMYLNGYKGLKIHRIGMGREWTERLRWSR